MRSTLKLTVATLGLATFAHGGDTVEMKTPTKSYDAEYTYAPGTVEQATIHFSVSRQFKFRFPESSYDTKKKDLVPDAEATVREYLQEDINETRGDAEKIKNLRFKTIDCRKVARKMVEHLIGHRVEAVRNKQRPDGESHYYMRREDQLDVALVAKALDRVTILRGEPGYSCKETRVGNERARCGDMKIFYKPRVAPRGPFKDQKAIVFNPSTCAGYGQNMSFEACELLAQIQGCGLRYVNKSIEADTGSAFTRGLSDTLETFKNEEVRARQNGDHIQRNSDGEGQTEEEIALPPENFYDDFKKPGTKPAR